MQTKSDFFFTERSTSEIKLRHYKFKNANRKEETRQIAYQLVKLRNFIAK